MVKTKRITHLAFFLCLSLVIHYFESLLPPVIPVAGIKMGLANCITLITLKLYGKKETAAVLFMRILIASLFFGGGMQFLYSFFGGLAAFLMLCLLDNKIKALYVLSAISAVFHNVGQVAVATALTKIPFLWWYLFPLTASAIISGAFTGIIANFILKNNHISKISK